MGSSAKPSSAGMPPFPEKWTPHPRSRLDECWVTPSHITCIERLMPANHSLHVALTRPLVDYVRHQVASGNYQNAGEVVRAALEGHARETTELPGH